MPLGIDQANYYLKFPNGLQDTNSLMMRPRDLLKIGVTYLNRGIWNGTRIVSEEWVVKSAVPSGNNHGIKVPGEPSGRLGYAYTWWTKEYHRSGKRSIRSPLRVLADSTSWCSLN